MGSINAQRMAIKVSENLSSNKLINMGKIARSIGYSKSVSNKPSLITNTKSYQINIEREKRPIIEGIQRQINKFKEEIEQRTLKGEDTRTLVGSLDIYIKNYQLLSGGATERQVFILPSEILTKNDIQTDKQDPTSSVDV